MGQQSVVYGIIEGYQNYPHKGCMYADLNRVVIESLPEEDDWPFLVRDLFAITKRNKSCLDYHF